MSDEHVDFEVELDADPDVLRYLGNGRPRTREDVEHVYRDRMSEAGVATIRRAHAVQPVTSRQSEYR